MFVVWFSMLPGDGRDRVDRRALSDPRVANLWDGGRLAGRWFSTNVSHEPGFTWDAYFLYGRDAAWTSQPLPLISWGSPVLGAHDDLARDLKPLLT